MQGKLGTDKSREHLRPKDYGDDDQNYIQMLFKMVSELEKAVLDLNQRVQKLEEAK